MLNYCEPLDPLVPIGMGGASSVFSYDYGFRHEDVATLADKGQRGQWHERDRIDWTASLPEDNPLDVPEYRFPLFGSPLYEKLSVEQRNSARRHFQGWSVSQFLHGEQAALLSAAKIVQISPFLEHKLFAATQVADEARHVKIYSALLDRIGVAFGQSEAMRKLMQELIGSPSWDLTYLGVQVVVEGLALASFSGLRDATRSPLVRSINAYVLEDEARHVAFGRRALKRHYQELTASEIGERADFMLYACETMLRSYEADDLWEQLGFPARECAEFMENSELMRGFRRILFSRVVPTVHDIGVWNDKVVSAFEKMGIIGFAALDPEELEARDIALASEPTLAQVA